MEVPQRNANTVSIVTWFLLVTSCLAVFARFLTKAALIRKFAAEDGILLAALAFSIGQSIAVSLQAANGLNRDLTSLSPERLAVFQKTAYASELCLIFNLCFTKISILLLIYAITPVRRHRYVLLGTGIVTISWALSSIFVTAFQCQAPRMWELVSGSCIEQLTFWNVFGVLNILTDSILILLPARIVWGIQASAKRKFTIFSCFALRTLVIAAIIVQLIFLNERRSNIHPFTNYTSVLTSQILQNTSIVTACIPYLKPFLESLESGMIRSDDLRRRHRHHFGNNDYNYSGGSYKLSDKATIGTFSWVKGGSEGKEGGQSDKSGPQKGDGDRGLVPFQQTTANVVSAEGGREVGSEGEWDGDVESQRSESRIIKTTRTWAVE